MLLGFDSVFSQPGVQCLRFKRLFCICIDRRGIERKKAATMIEGLYSDPAAQYAHVIELDAADITPMVATPGDPGSR